MVTASSGSTPFRFLSELDNQGKLSEQQRALDEQTGTKGTKSLQAGIKARSDLGAFRLFFSRLWGTTVNVEIGNQTYALGRKSLENFLRRNDPAINAKTELSYNDLAAGLKKYLAENGNKIAVSGKRGDMEKALKEGMKGSDLRKFEVLGSYRQNHILQPKEIQAIITAAPAPSPRAAAQSQSASHSAETPAHAPEVPTSPRKPAVVITITPPSDGRATGVSAAATSALSADALAQQLHMPAQPSEADKARVLGDVDDAALAPPILQRRTTEVAAAPPSSPVHASTPRRPTPLMVPADGQRAPDGQRTAIHMSGGSVAQSDAPSQLASALPAASKPKTPVHSDGQAAPSSALPQSARTPTAASTPSHQNLNVVLPSSPRGAGERVATPVARESAGSAASSAASPPRPTLEELQETRPAWLKANGTYTKAAISGKKSADLEQTLLAVFSKNPATLGTANDLYYYTLKRLNDNIGDSVVRTALNTNLSKLSPEERTLLHSFAGEETPFTIKPATVQFLLNVAQGKPNS